MVRTTHVTSLTEQNIREYYTRHAGWWAEAKTDSFWHEKAFRNLVKKLHSSDRVLDIGCANGIHVPLFLGIGRNLRYEGIDISLPFVRMARARYPQLTFTRGSILRAPDRYVRHPFHAFFAAAVFMHIRPEDWKALFHQLNRITKPNALGYITLPARRPNPQNASDRRYFSFWNRRLLRATIEPLGWRVVSQESFRKTKAGWQAFFLQRA